MEDFIIIKDNLRIQTQLMYITNEILKIAPYYEGAVDVLHKYSIPCRQTDLIQAACKTGKTVNIKKGHF